jgi:CDP-diacylglycerol--serine O-phosphatidyltransferase
MTLGNLLCGFAAIHFAVRAMYDFGAGVPEPTVTTLHRSIIERTLPPPLLVGAWLVLVGMLFDCVDGLLARVTRSTTDFGGQLDSLADVITFGVAPATLMVAFLTKEMGTEALPSPISEHFLGRAAWVSAAIYVSFTAVRLARYNVEHARADFDHRSFRGLPSPGAACVIVALILSQAQLPVTAGYVIVYTMPVVTAAIALLMVSRIPYRRFHRAYLLGRKPFSHVVTFVALIAVFVLLKAAALMAIVLWYAASGPLFLCARWLRERALAGHPRLAVVDEAPRHSATA